MLRCTRRVPALLLALLVALAAPPPRPAAAQQVSGEGNVVLIVDSPSDGAAVSATVSLAGWAIDVDTELGTGVDRVEVYVDGPRGVGTPLGAATYGLLRPDVGVARHSLHYNASGWSLDTVLPPGPRTLYFHAHRDGFAHEEGWSAPTVLALQVEGSAIAVPTGRSTTPNLPPVAPATGTLSPASGANSQAAGGCLVTDRDSNRCLVRNSRGNSGQNPTSSVTPGSWTVLGAAGRAGSASSGPVQGEIGVLGGLLSTSGYVYGMPIDLGSLGGHTTPTGGAAAGGASAPAAPVSAAVATLAGIAAPTAAGNTPASISLSATPTARGQFTLTWNQVGSGALYEVRRCPAYGSATPTCGVLAIVQGSSYQLSSAEGIYLIRAVTPQGQAQGESNRLQLCCRS